MTLMVLGKQQPALVDLAGARKTLEGFCKVGFLEQLFLQPNGQSHPERCKAAMRIGKVGLEQALEFQERLFEEDHIVEIVQIDLALLETIANCVLRESRIVLAAREALLLGRRNRLPVNDQRSSTVVIKGRDAQDTHAVSSIFAALA